jgi:plasmid stability protein
MAEIEKSIQIRNVPPKVHAIYRARAARAGKSLSEYLLEELRRRAEVPTNEELLERIRTQRPLRLKTRPADIIRADRDSR